MKMTRKDFIKKSAALGVGLPFLSLLLESCEKDNLYPNFEVNFKGKVIIIGAGAAGITAGYLLKRYNIDFEIIEASPNFGGRVKRADVFADFPIDLGAEWIHEDPSVLARLLSDPNVNANMDIIPYSPDSISTYNNGKLTDFNFGANYYSEYKFKSTTWFGFFEKFMIPDIEDKITYNSPVKEIDYSSDKVIIKNDNDDLFEADKVLVTVPIKILQNNSIDFIPDLPTEKIDAINSIDMPDGLKVFIEFSEKFYPDLLFAEGLFSGIQSQDKLFYNAAFRKESNRHILGLYSVGTKASAYTNLANDSEIKDKVLSELDEMFNGKATETYLNHVIQNWSNEVYIQGAFGNEFSEAESVTTEKLLKPVDNKVYFAGEALSADNGATVPGASETAYSVIETILKN